MEFEKVQEIACYLGRDLDALKIQKLAELTDSGKLYITFWGHYSAGKSKLINTLLKRDILPVQTRETTAVLTYVQYGIKEYGVIRFSDGTTKECGIEKIKSIFQNSSDGEIWLDAVDHVEVFIDNDMLKNGLVIVDTPGINTVIQKHQDLAVDAIGQSGKIVYVLGGAVSSVDRRFITKIAGCGIDILFARTKCDQFHEKEEDPKEALNNEKQEIEEIIESSVSFFPVSNEKNSEWYDKVEDLRTLLMELSFQSAKEMRKSCWIQIKKYGTEYEEILQERLKGLRSDDICKEDETERMINECRKKVSTLENMTDSREMEIAAKIEQIKKAAKGDLDHLVIQNSEKFADAMETAASSADAVETIKILCEKYLDGLVGQAHNLLTSYLDHLILEDQVSMAEFIPGSVCIPDPPTYEEVKQNCSLLIEQYRAELQTIRSELENTVREKQRCVSEAKDSNSSFDEAAYQQAIEELNRQLSIFPDDMILKISEDQFPQPSDVLKRAGQAVDIALLLLPGTTIASGVKAVVDSTKLAQLLHKMGKIGEIILSMGKAAAQNAGAVDKVRDFAVTMNYAIGKRPYSTKEEKEKAKLLIEKAAKKAENAYESYKTEKKNGNLLDVLSVAFWTEKLGAQFDAPPRMEVDTEAEENRRRIRQEITAEQNRIMEERIYKKKAYGLLETKEKELEAREREMRELENRIEVGIRKKERELKQKAELNALARYKQNYRDYFEKCAGTAVRQISEQYFLEAQQNISIYVAGKNAELLDAVQQEKNQLERLLEVRRQGKEAVAQEIEQCERCISELKEVAFV